MKTFPFEESPEEEVLVCRHLLEEEAVLGEVYHFDVPKLSWRFACNSNKHTEHDVCKTTLGTMLERYPEIEEISSCPVNCMLRKGCNSGKWYDFIFEPKSK